MIIVGCIACIALILAVWSTWATWQNTKTLGYIQEMIDSLKEISMRK